MYTNMAFEYGGGGIENASPINSTINEMLMQSHEGVIRILPCWNKKMSASFENLRADGAFLVSAKLENEQITSLSIKSIMGRKCNVECQGIKKVNRESDKAEIPFKKYGNTVSFETQADTTYFLI